MARVAGGNWRWTLAGAVAVGLLAIAVAGCGDDSASTTGSPGAGAPTTEQKSSAEDGGDQAAAEEFGTPGGDDSVQTYGSEAPAAERRAASAVVVGYLRAGDAEEWRRKCGYLSRKAIEPLERLGSGKGCVEAIPDLISSAPGAARVGAIAGPVGSLRVEGEQGFALYHGKDGKDYVMPLAREGGEWKIASLMPYELP